MKVSDVTLEDYCKAVQPDGSKVDPHKAVAARLFNVPYESVTMRMREQAKRALVRAAYTPPFDTGDV